MKVIINKNKLLESLKLCNSISENINTTPVFLGTLIEVKENFISLTSSNGLISIKSKIEKSENCNILSNGNVLVKTKTLFSMISKFKNENIILEKIDNSVLKIKTETFDSNINIMDDEQYPDINFAYKDWKEITIPAIVFKKTILKVKQAVNNNKEKPNIMSGICFISNKKDSVLEVIGTDSYKLAYLKFNSKLEDFKIVIDVSLIELFLELLNVNTIVNLYLSNNNIIFKINDVIISSKIIEGEFPSINRIISIPKENKIIVSKKAILEALDRGMILSSSEKKSITRLGFSPNKLEIAFNSIELGNSKEIIKIDSTELKKPEFILVNTNFLISILKVFENDEICIEFQDSLKPISFTDPKEQNFLELLVPVKG